MYNPSYFHIPQYMHENPPLNSFIKTIHICIRVRTSSLRIYPSIYIYISYTPIYAFTTIFTSPLLLLLLLQLLLRLLAMPSPHVCHQATLTVMPPALLAPGSLGEITTDRSQLSILPRRLVPSQPI